MDCSQQLRNRDTCDCSDRVHAKYPPFPSRTCFHSSRNRCCALVSIEEIVGDDAFQLRVQLIQLRFVRGQSSDGETLTATLLPNRASQPIEVCRDGGKFFITRFTKSCYDLVVSCAFD